MPDLTDIKQDHRTEPRSPNGWVARRERTRKKLLDAAIQTMAEVGIESVSVSAVARRAGVTRPGAYYHFDSRDALLTAVKEALDDEILRIVAGASKVEDVYSFPAEIAAEDDRLMRLRIVEMLENGSADILMASHIDEFQRKHEEKGRLKQGVDPEVAGMLACSSLVAALLAVSDGDTKEEKRELAKIFGKTYHQLIFKGLLKPDCYADWADLPEYFEFNDSSYKRNLAASLGRPEEDFAAKGGSNRNRLLDAAIDLMADIGEDAISVSEVTRRAGVSRPSFYYHFKSREELLDIVKKELDERLSYVIDASLMSRDPRAVINSLDTGNLNLLRLRVIRMIEDGAMKDSFIRYQKKVFKWHQEQGHLYSGVNPDMAAIFVSAMLLAAVIAVSEVTSLKEKRNISHRYGLTYQKLLFNGILDDVNYSWPKLNLD